MEERQNMLPNRVVAVVPLRPDDCAASLTIAGRSVLDSTVRALRSVPEVGSIVLALDGIAAADCLGAIDGPKSLGILTSSRSSGRWAAIASALAVAGEAETVLLHNPDRPLVSAIGIGQLLRQAGPDAATVSAMPVHSSIKRVVEGRIVATVPRENLHTAQSPWVFGRRQLEGALSRAIELNWSAVDELELVRHAGIPVRIAEGNLFNVPIASRADARFAEMAVGRQLVSLPGRLASPA
jgi:2-C-methyl-D-erythritol 4-phosphate cytidylyltransferase